MGWSYQQKPPLGWPLDYDSGLVPEAGFWLMNEDSGNKVFDLSGNGNDGTFVGTAPSWTSGKFGSAVLLLGTDEHISTTATLPATGDFTVVIQAKMTLGAGANEVLWNNGNNTLLYGRTTFGSAGGKMRFYIGEEVLVSTFAINDNISRQYIIVKSGQNHYLYIDGILNASGSTANSPDGSIFTLARNNLAVFYLMDNYIKQQL